MVSATGELVPLAACAGERPERVGRKAALLGWAEANGLTTPGGYVLPAERFWVALDACAARDQADYLEQSALRLDPRHVFGIATSIAEAMRSSAVEELAAADADAAFARLGAPRVVCRSSSVMEDGRAASFPGVFRSVLGLESPASLARAIADCWRSAFSSDAVRYLLRLRTEPVDFSLALVVQRHVEAAWYGIYVSVDPVTGAAGPRADLSSSAPDTVVRGGPATVHADRRNGQWNPALEAVHHAAARLAAHLGTEVDLEFALPQGDGPPVVLQCRPITRAPSQAAGDTALSPHLRGRPCAPGRAAGAGIAVVERLTTADYGIVFDSTGVVMEEDASPLSHVAILCRELGVPFVCGVDGARTILAGRHIALDGGTGVIEILQDGDEPALAAPRPARIEAVMTSVELLVRLLAEGRPRHDPGKEVKRVARRYARALGAGSVRLVRHPVDPAQLAALERLGTELFGPEFSAGAVLDGF